MTKCSSDTISRALDTGGSGKMLDYTVLKRGREHGCPDGTTIVYEITIGGDQLEIRGQRVLADNDSQRFRELKSGETVVSAI